jgi:hypothetical protein
VLVQLPIIVLALFCNMSTPSSLHEAPRRHLQRSITGHAHDIEDASKALLQGKTPVLQVIDAPFDGTLPTDRYVFSFNHDIEKEMKSLPPHKSGTARILDITVHSDFVITGLRDTKGPEKTRPAREGLMNYLQNTYTQTLKERKIFRWLTDPLLVNDIESISSQWSQRLDGDKPTLYRLVNRTSLQEHPLDFDLRPRDSYLTCAQDGENRLIGKQIFIYCISTRCLHPFSHYSKRCLVWATFSRHLLSKSTQYYESAGWD